MGHCCLRLWNLRVKLPLVAHPVRKSDHGSQVALDEANRKDVFADLNRPRVRPWALEGSVARLGARRRCDERVSKGASLKRPGTWGPGLTGFQSVMVPSACRKLRAVLGF